MDRFFVVLLCCAVVFVQTCYATDSVTWETYIGCLSLCGVLFQYAIALALLDVRDAIKENKSE